MMQASGVADEKDDRHYVNRLVSRFENFIPPSVQEREARKKEEKSEEKEEKKEQESETMTSKNKQIYPKAVLLALDEVYSVNGVSEPNHTSVHTPNEYVEKIVDEFPHIFACGASIHPYREDCVEKLQYYKQKGCKVIKWLPNSMGIDPASSKCDHFYEAMKELDLILLSHTGAEHALDDASSFFVFCCCCC
ncbi:Amidohydrolase 2 [Reticulomyxa filosa]|uniref:Amidohydrolase 2 n=1 Tax=Reticulomyxa filosa TaxID=46433 RepID=X6N853_RETFI|nr:Amidohydrolase 2 [Reticulomyxa filosa]|eukprot:ETO21909.1 Amidohydrolase 2 [Reticulomyxa filosa]